MGNLDTFCGRLKAAMMARGVDPTPEELSRVAQIDIKRTRALLKMASPPQAFRDFATIGVALRCRMYWITTGKGEMTRLYMYADSERLLLSTLNGLTEEQAGRLFEAAEIIASLDAGEARRWLRTGRHMKSST